MLPDRSKQNEAQSRINEAKSTAHPRCPAPVAVILLGLDAHPAFWLGGGGSGSSLFPVFPGWCEHLPPSTSLNQIMTLLLGMLGLGF